ncbi:uncharacterized protein LOC120090389 isoform X2 [Benincasa hispida]|uniref:uncharacterized protein LOC120090389 isoform X2 n=1 Tax=Benincasa hispida TaxID=102211 RepID=UPI0019029D65|nr:uncharacterized protein LOC120090389 isoform X2 [Benincasa hispida]
MIQTIFLPMWKVFLIVTSGELYHLLATVHKGKKGILSYYLFLGWCFQVHTWHVDDDASWPLSPLALHMISQSWSHRSCSYELVVSEKKKTTYRGRFSHQRRSGKRKKKGNNVTSRGHNISKGAFDIFFQK